MIKRIESFLLRWLRRFEVKKMARFSKFWPPFNPKDIPMSVIETDTRFNALYEEAQRLTQMEDTDNAYRRQRHYTLYYIFRNILKNVRDERVNIAEIGCWRGLSAYHTPASIVESGKDVVFHIFDSFEGLFEFASKDESLTIATERSGSHS